MTIVNSLRRGTFGLPWFARKSSVDCPASLSAAAAGSDVIVADPRRRRANDLHRTWQHLEYGTSGEDDLPYALAVPDLHF
jgi:hypothetical protein